MSKLHGPEDQETADALNYLGFLLYQDMGEYAKAEPLFQEASRIDQKVLGPDSRPGWSCRRRRNTN
jgi:tetratricopeptide (TPR) repeat protein